MQTLLYLVGSLYTSVLPNLLVPGIVEAIRASDARKMYICNAMTQLGETDGYSAADHLYGLISHCAPHLVDDILVNGSMISQNVRARYEEEIAFPVTVDHERLQEMGVNIICDDFVLEQDGQLRHNAKMVSEAILRSGSLDVPLT